MGNDSRPVLMDLVAIVPVKELSWAKSRLASSPLPHDIPAREQLASSFAKDVLVAATESGAVSQVVFVTRDRRLSTELAELGAITLPEPPELVGDLNAILAYGQRVVLSQTPGANIAITTADLATVTGASLRDLLNVTSPGSVSFVADHGGAGTTIVVNRTGRAVTTHFGANSADKHARANFNDLTMTAHPRLRLDVDTAADLELAYRIGLGPHTEALYADWRSPQSEGKNSTQ